jgi:transcriptional regulator with XRE-family HTH domain
VTTEKEPDPIDVHVGSRMQLRRTLLGMTQEQLAKAIGVSFQQVQKYERGLNRLSASRLFDVCQALGVSITYFFEDVPEDVLRGRKRNADVSEPEALGGKTRRPAGDLMAKTESLELVRSYWHMPSSQREKVRALIDTLARASKD